jgi:hypothetical protein
MLYSQPAVSSTIPISKVPAVVCFACFRAALLVLCLHALDTFQAAVAAGSAFDERTGAWGWPGRVAMAGLQLPLLLNLWGLLWPLCHPSSFEKHHTRWHRVSADQLHSTGRSIAGETCVAMRGMGTHWNSGGLSNTIGQ